MWAASLANCPPHAILDFSASINPLGPPASAIAAIQTNLDDLKAYPDPQYWQLRSALSQFHQIPPEWILPGNGSAELLTWACRDLSALDQTYLLTPAFGDYSRALKTFAAEVKGLPLDAEASWCLPWPLRTAQGQLPHDPVLQDQAAGLLLNNPHNPTGRLFQQEEILSSVDKFALVVVDEAFMDFLPPLEQQSVIDAIPHHPNLVVLRSLTKFYSLPGLRLGYAIAHPDRLQRWQQWRDPWSVNALAARAGACVVQDCEFQQQTWDWLPPTRTQLAAELAKLPGLSVTLGAANFLLVESQRSVLDLQKRLLQQQKILIRDCHSFPELGDRYFRVAVRTEAENQRLLAGLGEILLG